MIANRFYSVRVLSFLLALGTILSSGASADPLQWNVGDGDWDTTTPNWLNTDTVAADTFTDGDDVTFLTGANKTITVEAGGVTPDSTTISGPASGTLTFTGGPIGGELIDLAPHNTGGTGAHVVLQSPNNFTSVTIGDATTASQLTSLTNGALGNGTITFKGGSGNLGAWLRFGGSTQTHSNDIVFDATGVARQVFYHGDGAFNTRVTLTGNLIGNDDNLMITGPANNKVIELRPGPGKSVTGTGNVILNNGTLSISSADQLFSGNLNIVGGNHSVLILDNMSWSDFGRTQGNGPGQWNINGGAGSAGGGFAARGQDVVITDGNWNMNFALGYGDTDYANAAIKINTGAPINLTAPRTISLFGDSYALVNSTFGLDVKGPVHEINDAITGNQTLTLVGGNTLAHFLDSRKGGLIRFTNPDNQIDKINMNGGTAVAIFTSDAAFGGATVEINTTSAAGGGLVLFEDATPGSTGTTFTQGFTLGVLDLSGNINYAGFGSYAGNVTWTGTGVFTSGQTMTLPGLSGHGNVPVKVISGAMTFGEADTPATLTNNRGIDYAAPNFSGAIYSKSGAGEAVLRNIVYNGTNTNGFRWQLLEGTLTSESAALLTSGDLRLADLFAPYAGGASALQPPLDGRRWKVTTTDHTFNNVSGSGWIGNPTVEVADGITLTTNLAAGQSFVPSTAGAQTLVKTGGGTWVFNSPNPMTATGDVTDMFQIEDGTLDVRGNTGNAGFRIDGGTLRVADVSGFASGRAFEIGAAGGKIGISQNATGSVVRLASAPSINAWTQGGDVTFAARDNFDLVFANASFPDITAGTVRFERDGSGSGKVQLNDTAITVTDATIAGSGTLRLGAAGNGTLTLGNGAALAPGSSPGVLTLEGNITLDLGSSFLLEVAGVTPGLHDQLNIAGTVTLNGAELVLVGVPRHVFRGDMLTIIDNDGSDAVLGTFANLNEGDKVFFAGHHFAFISYVGGTGNDVVLTIIPEPAAAALLLSLPILWRRRISMA